MKEDPTIAVVHPGMSVPFASALATLIDRSDTGAETIARGSDPSMTPMPTDDRLSELRAELDASPDDPDVLLRIATHFHDQGSFELAATSAQRALQVDPRSADARLLLGKARMEQGRPGEAAFQFRQLLDAHPDHAEAKTCYEHVRRFTAILDSIRASNPRELQIDVTDHVIVLQLAGLMAPYTEDGETREPFDRLGGAIAGLVDLGCVACIIDLKGVHFLTSYFLGKLIEWRRKLLGPTRPMVICNARPGIRELIKSTRLVRLMSMAGTRQEAHEMIEREIGEGRGGGP